MDSISEARARVTVDFKDVPQTEPVKEEMTIAFPSPFAARASTTYRSEIIDVPAHQRACFTLNRPPSALGLLANLTLYRTVNEGNSDDSALFGLVYQSITAALGWATKKNG